MNTRCAGCKYLRRRCPSDCIFSPYFPPNDPQRFACIHRFYGASNVSRMLQQLPDDQRAVTVNSLYYEAQYRVQDPVYGSVGIISLLYQQIQEAETQLAQTNALIALLSNSNNTQGHQVQHEDQELQHFQPEFNGLLHEQEDATFSHFGHSKFSSGFF